MTTGNGIWQTIRTIVTAVDKLEANDRAIDRLIVRVDDMRERLAAVEAVVNLVRGRPLQLPPRENL